MKGFGTFLFGIIVGGPAAIITTVSIVGNSVALAEGHSSALGWRSTAWVTGLATAGAGALVLISERGSDDSFSLGLGIGEIALGVGSIGVAIGAGLAPEARPTAMHRPRWNLSPMAVRDARGDAAPGLQLSLTSF